MSQEDSLSHVYIPVNRFVGGSPRWAHSRRYEVVAQARIDERDFEYLAQFTWTLVAKKNATRYANRGIWDGTKTAKLSMNKEVWERHNGPVPDGFTVDHFNRDGLDNRLENLRCATVNQQGYNKSVPAHSQTGYKGVHWYELHRGFKAVIKLNGRRIYVGLFSTPEEAGFGYNHAATMLHGEFACLNAIPPGSVSPERQLEIEWLVGDRCAKFLTKG